MFTLWNKTFLLHKINFYDFFRRERRCVNFRYLLDLSRYHLIAKVLRCFRGCPFSLLFLHFFFQGLRKILRETEIPYVQWATDWNTCHLAFLWYIITPHHFLFLFFLVCVRMLMCIACHFSQIKRSELDSWEKKSPAKYTSGQTSTQTPKQG